MEHTTDFQPQINKVSFAFVQSLPDSAVKDSQEYSKTDKTDTETNRLRDTIAINNLL